MMGTPLNSSTPPLAPYFSTLLIRLAPIWPTASGSAKTGAGVDRLLEMISIQSEMLELMANPKRPGAGVVLEAYLDRGRGPVANLLVQEGTLKTGDIIVAGSTYGKIRLMTDERGRKIVTAFLVEKDFPGLIVGPEEKKLGIKGSSTTQIILDNCRVPVENLVLSRWGRSRFSGKRSMVPSSNLADDLRKGSARSLFEQAFHILNCTGSVTR